MLKKSVSGVFKVCLFLFSFLFFTSCVKADSGWIIPQGSVGNTSEWSGVGKSSANCKVKGAGCFGWYKYSEDALYFAYRITLVDENGERAPIFDEFGNDTGEKTYSVDFTGDKFLFDRFIERKYIHANGKKYNYKYGSNDSSKFMLVYDPKGPVLNTKYSRGNTGISVNTNEFQKFISEYPESRAGVDKYKKYMVYTYDNGKVKIPDLFFVDYFLHLNGYLSDDEHDAFSNMNKSSQLTNYYLIIEPTIFAEYGKGYIYTYGTVTELAKVIKKQGKNINLYHNANDIRKYAGSALYTKKKNIVDTGFKRSLNGATSPCPEKSSSTLDWYIRDIWYIANDDYAYGMYLIQLNLGPKVQRYNMDLCFNDDDMINEGIYDMDVSFDIFDKNKIDETLKNDLFKVSGDEENSVYCIDSVSYDFSELAENLSSTRRELLMVDVNSKPGLGLVIRRCLIPDTATYNIENELGSYMQKSISLNIYGKNYTFTPNIDMQKVKDSKTVNGNITSYTINIEYTIDTPVVIASGVSKLNSVASISFDDNFQTLFGASAKKVNNLVYGSGDIDVLRCIDCYEDKYDKKGYGLTCKFKYDVEGVDESLKDTDIVYRAISLDNPFPARDGSARLPGLNWLNEKNNVYSYILNNRGVRGILGADASPSQMYTSDEIKPMYSFVLDTATMAKIRSYNANLRIKGDNSYINKDNIKCNSNGRECYSTFIRDYLSDTHVDDSDVCFLTKSNDEIRNRFNQNIGEIDNYDYNFDGDNGILIFNASINAGYEYDDVSDKYFDDLVVSDNLDLNTVYYTCANKSFLSGGPFNDEVSD